MNKKLSCLIIALLTAAVCFSALTACSSKEANESESGLESGTLTGSELLSPLPTDSETQTEKKTEKPTEVTTEMPTEAPTEKPTEAPTEKPTEAPTEAETEPPVSLRFQSYGNGTCAVTGIGNYTDPYVLIPERSPGGDIVTVIEDKAFFENSRIKVRSWVVMLRSPIAA